MKVPSARPQPVRNQQPQPPAPFVAMAAAHMASMGRLDLTPALPPQLTGSNVQ